jgi:cyclopropane-fatty-acyl-phospholipid synthase
MWEFYLAASEASFRHDGLVVFQLQLAKRLGTLPMTRDYMSEKGRSAAEPVPSPVERLKPALVR